MKILYYDCFSGISGDMNLGAMIDLGVEKQFLTEELNKLNINTEFELEISRDKRKGIEGTKVTVHLKHHHHHHHHKNDANSHHHHHEHRNLKKISDLIQKSTLNKNVKDLSIAIFKHIALAEAKVHGKSIDEIHFHEVGATDSIVDIVGAAICFHALKVDKVFCSSIELGSGFVKCAHGTMPVPAPATAEIIRNLPSKQGTIPFEATTPTGAAILAELVDEFTDTPNFKIEKTGYGIGQKDFDIPNALRVYLAEVEEGQSNADLITSEEVIIECNIDDMNPEHYEIIFDILLDKGAKDVFIDSILMKKMRPAHKLSVLCENSLKEKMIELIIRHTSTFGVRVTPVKKYMLTRKEELIQTEFGPIRIKKGYYKSKCIKVKAEYADCKQIAANKQIPVSTVYSEVNNLISKFIDS